MKKGFTLIELLAVIVILSIIGLIATPIIMNVVEEGKRSSLESNVRGLLEAADYFVASNDGVYEFLFDDTHKGTTKQGESLDYKGELNANGKLYIDKYGNTSICIYNDKYYAYKNYNSGIVIGNKSEDNCDITFDSLTNRYIAYLESEGTTSNVYSKEEVNELIQELKDRITQLEGNQSDYATKEELAQTNSNVDTLTSSISDNKTSINNIKKDYALKSELNTTNSNLNSLTSIANNNSNNISSIQSTILKNSQIKSYNYVYNTTTLANGTATIQVKNGILYFYIGVALKNDLAAWGTVNIGTIENWDLGLIGHLTIAHTLYGESSSSLSIQIDSSGNVSLVNHGGTAPGSNAWYIGRGSIILS